MIDLEIFSPIHRWEHPVFSKAGLNVFIKRDDLIHPLISGNKWRKLKYALTDACSKNRTHLVTFGGAFSNHLLATAAAAARFGFMSTGFVRGEAVENDTLFLCRLHGMQLIFVDRTSYRDKHSVYNEHFGDNDAAYFIDEGGASPHAVKGCSELVSELPITYDHLFCACGTGATAAGIITGLQQHDLHTRFHAVPVLKNGEQIRQEIDQYLHEPSNYTLHTSHHFGGYAKTTPQLISFIEEFIRSTGILIEPVYTGKMLYAVLDLATKGTFASGSNILTVHSGGIFGLLGMKDKF
ncbi:pyridoxal-phosphate dependent enzyme [Mucilaginibacter daejeonensis]|uniref:1-aminocyclopropane-1-carboxylate deaminase/D-cysteine desulfhydrase n=1 Tax=Mucilaginibacter daejeonensis TaxID=398049 RepID=UPI001D174814|nr:pyridoxal-phosphate dependent enzyme [Mucilaginibacter daejeonensis]UEG51758.1 pyridoxal-phosphate dependent enzyme [Mucilaginibacter daejeonensis]